VAVAERMLFDASHERQPAMAAAAPTEAEADAAVPPPPPAPPALDDTADGPFGGGLGDTQENDAPTLESLGGGNPLDPLDEEVASPSSPPGGNPLDPLEDETASAGTLDALGDDDDEAPSAIGIGGETEQPLEEVLHLPLARLVSEIRRSFDYYEQQLYEQPVDRVLLSGGLAQLPLLAQTLREELGFDEVDVADPSQSALQLPRGSGADALQEQPAQFMVAVGLAARGVSEL
jgi:hypothetical protein